MCKYHKGFLTFLELPGALNCPRLPDQWNWSKAKRITAGIFSNYDRSFREIQKNTYKVELFTSYAKYLLGCNLILNNKYIHPIALAALGLNFLSEKVYSVLQG